MRGKVVLLVGGVVALILSILFVWSVANEEWVVVAAAAAAMASAILLIGLDTWRRVSTLRPFVRTELRRTVKASLGKRPGKRLDMADESVLEPLSAPPAVQQADVVGTVRLLQAQYTGRLDRMQTSVEMALAALAEKETAGPPTVLSVPHAPDTGAGSDAAPNADSSANAETRPT